MNTEILTMPKVLICVVVKNMDIIKGICKYGTIPIVRMIQGRGLSYKNIYEDRIKKTFKNYDHNIKERNHLLYETLLYALNHVPFYKELAKDIHLSEETVEQDIIQFPILTKDIIRTKGSLLYSDEQTPYYINTSGGSTGEPVAFRQDKRRLQFDDSAYFMTYAGYDLGDKYLIIWGSERDIIQGSQGIKALVGKYALRYRMINSFSMDENDFKKCVEIINTWKPKVIRAYVQSIYEIAQYIERNRINIFSPTGIIVSAGTLYSDWKEYIEKVFHCPVCNQYGSREVGGIAIGCKEEGTLHINMFSNYVEILDDNYEQTEKGEEGQIIVTNLLDRAMPIIRYQIGDMGTLGENINCSCKRHTTTLKNVTGRTVNIFKTASGKKVDGEYFTHLFYGKEWIKKFQVVQKSFNRIEIHIVSRDVEKNKEDIVEIEKCIQLVMGEDCNVEFFYEQNIEPSPSGKFIYTISEI